MSINLYFLIGIVIISESFTLETAKREYVIVKDMVSGRKAGQFSIYSDQMEKNLRYRIESYYSPMPKIELHTYPEKKSIGKLNVQQIGTWYQARYEILDARNKSSKWYTGNIKRHFRWFKNEYSISLAERTLTMKSETFARGFKFYNEAKKLLASYKTRRFIIRPTTIYDMKIFSNEFPDGVYILALAAHDHRLERAFG